MPVSWMAGAITPPLRKEIATPTCTASLGTNAPSEKNPFISGTRATARAVALRESAGGRAGSSPGARRLVRSSQVVGGSHVDRGAQVIVGDLALRTRHEGPDCMAHRILVPLGARFYPALGLAGPLGFHRGHGFHHGGVDGGRSYVPLDDRAARTGARHGREVDPEFGGEPAGDGRGPRWVGGLGPARSATEPSSAWGLPWPSGAEPAAL